MPRCKKTVALWDAADLKWTLCKKQSLRCSERTGKRPVSHPQGIWPSTSSPWQQLIRERRNDLWIKIKQTVFLLFVFFVFSSKGDADHLVFIRIQSSSARHSARLFYLSIYLLYNLSQRSQLMLFTNVHSRLSTRHAQSDGLSQRPHQPCLLLCQGTLTFTLSSYL